MKRLGISVSFFLFFFVSCNRNSGSGQHATVLMRDGTSTSGTVVSTSGSEIQLAGDDKVTRTIPMAQVRSIEYQDAPAAVPPGNTPAAAGTSLPVSAPSPPRASAPPPREAPHT